eukprot:jgi/Ulvmu1/6382/UM003_0010.1
MLPPLRTSSQGSRTCALGIYDRALRASRRWPAKAHMTAMGRNVTAKSAQPKSSGAWENQRYYYAFGWHAPLPLDGPNYWTSLTGQPLDEEFTPVGTLAHHAEDAKSDHDLQHWADEWVVEVSPATDPQGWVYASQFGRFDTAREGGRACRRGTDFVRRRKWLKRSSAPDNPQRPPLESSSSRSFVSASDAMHVTAASAAAADDTRRSNTNVTARTAAKAFFSMLQDAGRRRGGGLMSIPWDPMSWGSVYSEHSTWLANTQAMLLPRRLRPALRAQPAPGADAAAPAAVAYPGDATLTVSRDPCTTSRGLDERRSTQHSTQQPTADAGKRPVPHTEPAAAHKEARHEPPQQPAPPAAAHEGGQLEDGLLEDMQAAVDFARAAYGYAFLCGGMSSIARYLHMQTVQRSTFDIISGVSAEANTQAMCAVAGIPIRDVLLAEWNNTTYRPCHVIAVDRTRQRLVLTVRGSLELGDLLTDLHAKPIAVHLPCLEGEAHVHEGMLRAAAFVHCNTAETLARASRDHSDWPLFVTGHSLGGGVAALVAVLLRQPGGAPERLQENGITCMTVGTGSSMCAPLADACSGFVSSLVLGSDAVPRLSHHTVENLLDELIRKSPALNFAETVRTSVASTLAPLAPGSKAAAQMAPQGKKPEDVQLAELPAAPQGFAGLDLEGDAARAADAPHVKAAQEAAEMGERGAYASVPEGGVGEAADSEGEELGVEEVAAVGDGMAAAEARPPVRAEEEGNVWQRLLRPVEGLLRNAREQQTPFSQEALRAYAQRWRDKAAAAAEPGPDADLAGVSVADPLRYLAESGISRSGRTAAAAAAAAAAAGGASEGEAGEVAAAAAAPAPELQTALPSAPSGVRAMDSDVLREADAGHAAAAAADAAPPPPLYPPGRLLWLIPLRRKANGAGGSLDVEITTSTSLLSTPKKLTAAEVFHDSATVAVSDGREPQAEADAEGELEPASPEEPLSPLELQDRSAGDANGTGKAMEAAVTGRAANGTAGSSASSTAGSGGDAFRQGRSMFMHLAGDAMLGPDPVPAPSTGSTPQAHAVPSALAKAVKVAEQRDTQHSAALGQQAVAPGALTQAGADVASGAFEAGIGRIEISDGSEGWSDEGAEAAAVPAASGAQEVAPNWLLNLVRRRPHGPSGRPNGATLAADSGAASPALQPDQQKAKLQPDGAGLAAAREPVGPPSAAVQNGAADSGAMSAAAEAGEGGEKPPVEGAAVWDGQSQFVIEDSAGGGAETRKGREHVHDMAVLDVTRQRDVFNYLTLGADMIQDHLPDSYTKAVALLKRHSRQECDIGAGQK